MCDQGLVDFTKCDIFTPDKISELMASKLTTHGTLLEPAVGTGNLLRFIKFDDYTTIDTYELKKSYIDELPKAPNVNVFNGDFVKMPVDEKYDNIIMNPPYIKAQDLSINYRKYLKETFTILNGGILDIYYAFIIKCLTLLKDGGVMVAVTPNTYLYNKSSLGLRQYLFDNNFIKEIIDFKDEKIFKKVSVYCCITVFTKTPKTHLLYNGTELLYSDIVKNYSIFNFNKNTRMLKDICKIKNGIATLRDAIFIHAKKLFDEPCWCSITNGPLEKSIIYPYENGRIIEESVFSSNNPLTYEFLLSNKDELAKRDKGNKTYPAWYAYGRSQSIRPNTKKCIYIPCFMDPKNIEKKLFINQNILHIGCLCIEPNDDVTIDEISKHIINSRDFINENSSKRSGGWVNISSRTLLQIML